MRFLGFLIVALVAAKSADAQSKLSGPIEQIDNPIVMEYSALAETPASLKYEVIFFKGNTEVRGLHDSVKGLISADNVDGGLQVSFKANRQGRAQQQTCKLLKTGELVECTSGKQTYPVYDRPSYKSGDVMRLPFVKVNKVPWTINGQVRGKSAVGSRSVLVVEFAESMDDSTGLSDSALGRHISVNGFAYMDILTGHPVDVELTGELSGLSAADHDRITFYLAVKYDLPGTVTAP